MRMSIVQNLLHILRHQPKNCNSARADTDFGEFVKLVRIPCRSGGNCDYEALEETRMVEDVKADAR